MLKGKAVKLIQSIQSGRFKSAGKISKRDAGFSLIELLVVLVLLGIIAGIVVPSLSNNVTKGKVRAAKLGVQKIASEVENYSFDVGGFPDRLGELVESSNAEGWFGPYVKQSALKDPWNREYVYRVPGEGGRLFEVISYGSDGSQGGDGPAADISNWD